LDDHEATVPLIGIFWRIRTSDAQPMLLADCVPVDGAEPYGDFLTHGGHYEFWSKLADMSGPQLRHDGFPDVAKWSEYEEWPRGRVVFHVPTSRFVVYADRKLRKPTKVESILRRFSLPADRTAIRGDSHYVSVR
jgi:hypothetical protein